MGILHGRRILHILSPVQFEGNVFNHDRDSNYKCTERFIRWLPECHHYLLVPTIHRIPDNRSNVTLIKFPYPHNAVSNRSQFDATAFLKVIDMKQMDFDFLFCNQPELMYNVLVALMDRRYGEMLHRFAFYHWVDCSASRGSPAIPPSYMRQLEAMNLCTKFFVHSDVAINYLESNFKRLRAVRGLDHNFLAGKKLFMPTSIVPFGKPIPFELPKDKKIIVFNHRWSQTTGVNRFLEYTAPLLQDSRYLLWVTDPTAEELPKGYRQSKLSYGEYQYLMQNAYCSVCFVDGYATWNLSVQDGLTLNKPVLVFKHPVMADILGKDSVNGGYPFYFETQEEFLKLLEKLPRTISWPLDDHDAVFKKNLLGAMEECVSYEGDTPKDALTWAWYILNGLHYKNDITNQIQSTIQLNSVWQYIRRWLMNNGFTDNPNSPYTSYSVIPDKEAALKELVKDLKLRINAKTNKQTIITKKNHGFWE